LEVCSGSMLLKKPAPVAFRLLSIQDVAPGLAR
jgi:hypothetical protein